MKDASSGIENLSQKQRLLASREQNSAFEAQGRRVWLRENRAGFVTAFFLLAFMPLGFAYWTYWNLRTLRILDTPAKQGQAYIIGKDATPMGGRRGVMQYDVYFRLNGQQIKATTFDPAKWAQTQTDTRVPVTYHVGENGVTLISDWQTPTVK